MKTWINNNSSREILKSHVLQYTEKSNRVESFLTTAQHTLDRTRKVTILAKDKVTETEGKSACWEEHDGEGKKPLYSWCFFITSILKYCFCISRNNLASKIEDSWEKWENRLHAALLQNRI